MATKATKRRKLGVAAAAKARGAPADDEMMSTAISLTRRDWKLLRAVSIRRSLRHGGRPSSSAIINELVERHRKELEKEGGTLLEMMDE